MFINFLVHIQKGTTNDKPQLCLHRQSYFLHDRTKWYMYINSRTFWYVYKKKYCQHILTMLLLSKVKMVHRWSTFRYIDKKDQIINEKNIFHWYCCMFLFVCLLSLYVFNNAGMAIRAFRNKNKQSNSDIISTEPKSRHRF